MRQLIASMNMTLDGICDHTAGIADEELHDHYTELLRGAGALLYGRVTYQLMEFWRDVQAHPTGQKSMDDFAVVMDQTPKVVFSRTMDTVSWSSARLATQPLEAEVKALKAQPGKPIYAGSPSLIVQLMNLHLVDELHLCIHPVIQGSGKLLFNDIADRTLLNLKELKRLGNGTLLVRYEAMG